MLKIYILFLMLTVAMSIYERDFTFAAVVLIFGIAALPGRTAEQANKERTKRKGAKKCTETELDKRCA